MDRRPALRVESGAQYGCGWGGQARLGVGNSALRAEQINVGMERDFFRRVAKFVGGETDWRRGCERSPTSPGHRSTPGRPQLGGGSASPFEVIDTAFPFG